jgi:hypothetical protein
MAKKKEKGASSGRQSEGNQSYYYVQGQRINVSKRDDLIAVRFQSRAPAETIKAFGTARSADLEPSDEFQEMQGENLRIYRAAAARAADVQALETDIRSHENVEKVGEVYADDSGRGLVLTDELVVKFKPEMTSDQIESLKTTYGLETEETLGFSENAYVLRVKPGSAKTSLEIANDLVEKGQAVYANPNWIEHIPHRVLAKARLREEVRHTINDPLFANQWHLENTGQGGGTSDADVDAHATWHITLGDPNIRVAIVDLGIDIAHEDLNTPGKIIDALDLDVTPPDNNPAGGAHGTSCAGVAVAAQNNNRGVSGIAPGCRLIPIRAASDQTSTQVRLAQAFQYAADRQADVISCSLGPDGVPWLLNDALREAFDYTTTYGRNGRGCVIFWAGGNGNESISTDQIVSYERTIAVGASTNQDRRAGYSDFGPELDITAPSNGGTLGITTTTNSGTGPATVDPSRNYTDSFGGTSSASPLAAGIGALALSVNGNLSWEEVRQVLLDSSDKIDAVANPYNPAPAGRPPGTRNDLYGYGRVNAQRAVQLAQAGSARDLYIRDTLGDMGTVPQPTWGFWDSPDIWVRNADDGGTTHQNTVRGQDNFIHARVWNRGTQSSLPCWVRFYITTFAGTEFRYPYDYKPDTTTAPAGGTPGNLRPRAQFPTPATYLVGVHRIESIPAGSNVIAKVGWERTLIPPAANWHPCLLVEISPHDGPAPAGQYVWENNNLGQKNITIVDARRGQLIEFPYRFSHITTKDPFVTLNVQKVKAPRDLAIFVDVKRPQLLEAIASAAGVTIPISSVAPVMPITPVTPVFPISPFRPNVPWQLTFLEETRIALSSTDTRAGEEGLVFTFPRGSSVEIGRGQIEDLRAEEGLQPLEMLEGTEEMEEERARRPVRPAFSITSLEGVNVLALNPALKLAKVKVPLAQSGWQESSLKVRVPENAVPGDSYVFDVAEQNSKGQLVGGVRLQVNVVA